MYRIKNRRAKKEKAGILLQNRLSGNEKGFHLKEMKASILSRARRIRTFKMTESESAALPFGYSPMDLCKRHICRLRIMIIEDDSRFCKPFFKKVFQPVLRRIPYSKKAPEEPFSDPSGSRNLILRVLPHCRCQQHQHRIQFETACKHIKHKDILGDRLHKAEVAGRADLGKAGSDIVECTGY